MTGPTINSLQAGRGIAALAVVVSHAALAARDFARPFFGHEVLELGYLGVDFFFVLSGFIIYHSTVDRGRAPLDYALARIRRVYLPYLPLGIAMASLYTLFPSVSAGDREWTWLASLSLAPINENPALSVAWTLKHEILFYLLFGLFYYARLLWVGLALWLVAIIVAPLPSDLPFRLINLEFFMGIAAALLYRHRRAHPALAVGACLFAASWIALGHSEDQRILMGACFACLVAPAAQLEAQRRLSVSRWFVLLGAASYSLYLVHLPIVSAVARIVPPAPSLIILAAVVASIGAGGIYHFGFERRVLGKTGAKKANPEVFVGS